MAKKELNIGEQLVTTFAGDIQSGKFDDCIVELPADNLGSIIKYKFQFQYEGHILDGIIAIYERSFEYNEWIVIHDILQGYRISNEVGRYLFYAMDGANARNINKAIKANEKKIVEYLNARNNPIDCREPVVLDFEPTIPIETINAAVDKALGKYLKQV